MLWLALLLVSFAGSEAYGLSLIRRVRPLPTCRVGRGGHGGHGGAGSSRRAAEDGGSEGGTVSATDALAAVNGGTALILDVREFGELTFSGSCGGLPEGTYEHVPVMRWEHGMWLPRPAFLDNALAVVDEFGSDDKRVLVLSRDGGGRTGNLCTARCK